MWSAPRRRATCWKERCLRASSHRKPSRRKQSRHRLYHCMIFLTVITWSRRRPMVMSWKGLLIHRRQETEQSKKKRSRRYPPTNQLISSRIMTTLATQQNTCNRMMKQPIKLFQRQMLARFFLMPSGRVRRTHQMPLSLTRAIEKTFQIPLHRMSDPLPQTGTRLRRRLPITRRQWDQPYL